MMWAMSRQGDRRRAARYVAARRGALGLTQEALAAKAVVDPKTVWNLESGERWPQARNRTRIEIALGWTEGDMQRIADGGLPATGPESVDDETQDVEQALLDAVGTPEFDEKFRASLAQLPKRDREIAEGLLEEIEEANERNRRLLQKVVVLFRRRNDGDDGDQAVNESVG